MSYFKNFPKVIYSFGDGEVAAMKDLTVYAEVLDDVKNNGAFYQSYYIKSGERPDQVAFNLYKNAELHWTLYLMNDSIRELGWPISNAEVNEKVKVDYPGLVLRTTDELFDKFKVGERVRGNQSGAEGTIVFRDLNLGQLVLEEVTGTFIPTELVGVIGTNITITIEYTTPEHLAPRYHLDEDGEQVDFDPFTPDGELITEVSQKDYYIEQNDKLRQISVLRPSVVNEVVLAFRDAVRK
jgi:hypothetical protein